MSEQNNNISANNRRIAKNTIFMYFRMFITMACGLYTSRVVLQSLGVEDYGLYNVIGGIIAMFGFLNGAMTNTTSRYITFHLGKKDESMLSNVFSMSFFIHVCIALIIVILGETVGLWYLYNKLVVAPDRFEAALWLYQLSIASMVVNILYVPYNATIVAHERMSAFAYISIMDAVLRLLIAISITYISYDSLIYYGFMMFLIPVIDTAIYFTYCSKNFSESRVRLFWNSTLFKEMFGFASWSLIGNAVYIFYTQGINLVLNAFCGPSINAARGIAVQVDGVVRQFATNVQTSINPQIIKSFADNDIARMHRLIFFSSKISFYLIFVISIPLIIEMDYILSLWLINVPEHASNFLIIILVGAMVDNFGNSMFTANLATGKVKMYQKVLCSISISIMPVTYLAMKFSGVPESVFFCIVLNSFVCLIAKVFVMKIQINMIPKEFAVEVLVPAFCVCILSIILPYYLHSIYDAGFMRFFIVASSSVMSCVLVIYFIGINKAEKNILKMYITKKIKSKV